MPPIVTTAEIDLGRTWRGDIAECTANWSASATP